MNCHRAQYSRWCRFPEIEKVVTIATSRYESFSRERKGGDSDRRKPASVGKQLVKEDARLKKVAGERVSKCAGAIITNPKLGHPMNWGGGGI